MKYVAILNRLINVSHAGQGVGCSMKFIISNHDTIWAIAGKSRSAISLIVI